MFNPLSPLKSVSNGQETNHCAGHVRWRTRGVRFHRYQCRFKRSNVRLRLLKRILAAEEGVGFAFRLTGVRPTRKISAEALRVRAPLKPERTSERKRNEELYAKQNANSLAHKNLVGRPDRAWLKVGPHAASGFVCLEG